MFYSCFTKAIFSACLGPFLFSRGPVIRTRVSDNSNIYRPKSMIQSVWRIDNSYEALLGEDEDKRLL